MKKLYTTLTVIGLILLGGSVLLTSQESSDPTPQVGPRAVQPTPLAKGEIFASPNANPNSKSCSKSDPCTLDRAIMMLNSQKRKNVLFLRGGRYQLNKIIHSKPFINKKSGAKKLKSCQKRCQKCPKEYRNSKHFTLKRSGSEERPIIIESYPNEWAVLDGGNHSIEDIKNETSMVSMGFEINRNIKELDNIHHLYIRRLEITGMRTYGLRIRGSHNRVEGCKIHHNFLEGISIAPKNFKALRNQTSFNIITDNQVYNNSDAGLSCYEGPNDYNQGEHADGISITAGEHNLIAHNESYNNSDDGIDTFNSNYSKVHYNSIHHNGKGKKGNGNGLKTGGCNKKWEKQGKCKHTEVGLSTESLHNVAYNNKKSGFASNSGTQPIFKFNRAYDNGKYGFHVDEKSILESNIAHDNARPPKKVVPQTQKNNSWQKNNSSKKSTQQP
jgi:hypothetical protein